MITIREARAGDAPAIATAHVAAWRAGYRGVFPDAYLDGVEIERTRHEGWPRRLALGARRADREFDVVLAAELDGRVVGFGHVGPEDVGDAAASGLGEVYGFYLHPDAWGSGAATELMRACESELAAGFTSAVLWTLLDTPRSRRFYEKAGWTCGEADELRTTTWDLTGDPVTVVQYRRSLR